MSLSWPWALAALLVVPLLLLARWWANRRRRKVAVRVSSVALIRAAVPGRTAWRRRIPVILFVAALVFLAVGAARPQASVRVPSNATSILLAIDVSRSMCSTDVQPNRIAAAQAAAREFIKAQGGETKIGLVTFSGIAALLVEPTTDQEALLKAIDELRTGRGTAIGQAILTSIDAIAETNPAVPPTGVTSGEASPAPSGAPAEYQADTIVVLTDGANTQGVEPVTAAEQASARGLRVYPIGFGTTQPAPMVCTADQISGGSAFGNDGGRFGGGFGGGGGRVQQIDEDTLEKVAEITGGEYFRAEDADQLQDVLTDLPSNFVGQQKLVEVSVWFVLLGTLLAIAAVVLSLRWNRSLSARST
ncbi:MAG: VWA domain-containing protein [Hamadaea sp.]|uniref:VWA domain-containing protein n=1 Tax=Hamadaea sp. TaxID=2024425 RepID=UPI0017C39410|nr:VWA domain-containing protein [Hamadaea sp.]NUR70487.1 VWA domain-containing protein [Hamadaea sp.]NUT18094.1 VWA domain-containing protein [Hamadaea sp.]